MKSEEDLKSRIEILKTALWAGYSSSSLPIEFLLEVVIDLLLKVRQGLKDEIPFWFQKNPDMVTLERAFPVKGHDLDSLRFNWIVNGPQKRIRQGPSRPPKDESIQYVNGLLEQLISFRKGTLPICTRPPIPEGPRRKNSAENHFYFLRRKRRKDRNSKSKN